MRPTVPPRDRTPTPQVAVPHKDALACIEHGRRRVISIDGQRYRIGALGRRAGVGTITRSWPLTPTTLAAKFLEFPNPPEFAYDATSDTEGTPLPLDDEPVTRRRDRA
jgi:hypothetical protein